VAVHGNETYGIVTIRRVLSDIEQGRLTIVRDAVTLVPVSNPKAYELHQREGDRNLNRNLAPTAQPREFEDHLANWLCPLLGANKALDLHSFHTPGKPVAMAGPEDNIGTLEPFSHAAEETALALRLGLRRMAGYLR
jgi:uncharacterized protein